MKRLSNLSAFRLLSTLVLALLSVMTGGAFAFAAIAGAPEVPGENNKGVDLTGTPASASSTRDGDKLAEPEIDSYIAKFRPYLFPLESDMRTAFRQEKVKGYEVDHYASGATNLDCVTTQAFSPVGTDLAQNIISVIATNDKIMFALHSTVLVHGVNATVNGTANGEAILFVTEKTASTITCECLNGDTFPSIPATTKLSVLSNACAESEMNVSPENYQPKPSTVYLQKKIVNIVMTDHFKEIIKKVPFFEQDLRDNALYNFRRKNSRTAWVGYQSKVLRAQDNNMGSEYVYTSEGVLRQITSSYTTQNTQITYSDLIAITKMQFTQYSASNVARCYCGKNFLENLLNIDFSEHKDVQFTSSVDARNIQFKNFITTFGTLEFVYDPTLDDLGYEDICVVIDYKNGIRYVKDDERTLTTDMKKGGTENREAKRDVVIQADAIALKGYNSIIVKISGSATPVEAQITVVATTMSDIPTSGLVDGMIIYLTQDWTKTIGTDTVTVPAMTAITYKATDASNGKWYYLGGDYIASYNAGSWVLE